MQIEIGTIIQYKGLNRKVTGIIQMENAVIVLFQNRSWAYAKDVALELSTTQPISETSDHQ